MAIKNKIILIIAIAVVILGTVSLIIFRSERGPSYEFAVVQRGDIIEEISATGVVKPAQDVNLRFETSGTVEKIYVSNGSRVKPGGYLVKLATGKLYSQFLQAQASYNQARAELNKLLAGAADERIKIAEQIIENAKISLDDARAKAENDLQQNYNSVLTYLVDAYSKCNKALVDLRDVERLYFKLYFYQSTSVENIFRDKLRLAETVFERAEEVLGQTLEDPTYENIDLALLEIKTAVQKTFDALNHAKTAMSDSTVRERVSATDRATIDTDITNINTAYSNIYTAQANIVSQKITNQININSAENTLAKARVDLEELIASPREVDIAVYQANVDKGRALMVEFQQKLDDAILKAPIEGVISKVNVKIGEVVTAGGSSVVSLISVSKFEIEVDIPEADIGKVHPGNPVEISLDAFPEESWPGQVAEIEPAETIIEGVVYYRVTVVFDKIDERVKSGMSADVTIETNKKENVFSVPYRAVVYKEGKKIVRVLEGEEMREIEVETGLKGNKGEVEIIKGLKEGDKVITFIKSR